MLESKLSDLEGARAQLRELYSPVMAMALGEAPLEIAVVRHLTALRGLTCSHVICDSLGAAFAAAQAVPGALAIWHWRERSPIGLGSLVPQPPIPPRRALPAA